MRSTGALLVVGLTLCGRASAGGEEPLIDVKNMGRVFANWFGAGGGGCYWPSGGDRFEVSMRTVKYCGVLLDVGKKLPDIAKDLAKLKITEAVGDAVGAVVQANASVLNWSVFYFYVPTWYVEIIPKRGDSLLGRVFSEIQNLGLYLFEYGTKYAVGPVLMAPFGGSQLALDSLASAPGGMSARGRGWVSGDHLRYEAHVWRLRVDHTKIVKFLCSLTKQDQMEYENLLTSIEVFPAWYSEMDWVEWNWGLWDYGDFDEKGIPKGVKFWEMIKDGATVNKLKGWGRKYPRSGDVEEFNPQIAAAVLAMRAISRMSSYPWKEALGSSAPGGFVKKDIVWSECDIKDLKCKPYPHRVSDGPWDGRLWDALEDTNNFRYTMAIPRHTGCFKGGEEWYGWIPVNPLSKGFGFVVWEKYPFCVGGIAGECMGTLTSGAIQKAIEGMIGAIPVVGQAYISAEKFRAMEEKLEAIRDELKTLSKYKDKAKKVVKYAKTALKVAAVAGAAWTAYEIYDSLQDVDEEGNREGESGESPGARQGMAGAVGNEGILAKGCVCAAEGLVIGCEACAEDEELFCVATQVSCPEGDPATCLCGKKDRPVRSCTCNESLIHECEECPEGLLPLMKACKRDGESIRATCMDRAVAITLGAFKGNVGEDTQKEIAGAMAKIEKKTPKGKSAKEQEKALKELIHETNRPACKAPGDMAKWNEMYKGAGDEEDAAEAEAGIREEGAAAGKDEAAIEAAVAAALAGLDDGTGRPSAAESQAALLGEAGECVEAP